MRDPGDSGSGAPPDRSRYVRLFDRPPFVPPLPPALYCASLAKELILREGADDDERLDHASLGAGYTYFGQFLAHDATRIELSESKVANARARHFELESLYGDGPARSPWFFDGIAPARFLIGGFDDPTRRRYKPEDRPEDVAPWRVRYLQTDRDLQRNGRGFAIIPDARNDLTVMTSQLHLAMQLAHNEIESRIKKKTDTSARFELARTELTRRYHYVILRDYLPRILHPAMTAELSSLTSGSGSLAAWSQLRDRLLPSTDATSVPREFAFAAFRFGHTLVRPSYSLNEEIRAPIDLLPIAEGQSSTSFLGGQRPLPDGWTIDWSFFLPNDDGSVAPPPPPGLKTRMQTARRIDTKIAHSMSLVPPSLMPGMPPDAKHMSPVFATLWRGIQLGLPSGSDVKECVIASFAGLCSGYDFESGAEPIPLWLWLLREAEADCNAGGRGETLGLVGSILVFESILAMLAADPQCYLNSDPTWVPSEAKNGRYTLRQLLETGWTR